MKHIILTICLIILPLLYSAPAIAACTSPAGVAGTMDYFGAPDNTFKFCNGTSWIDMGPRDGGGSLSGLSDVNITSPSDGQPLVYDGATSKWVNATCDNVPASVSFTDLNDQAVSSVISSNILQITGLGCTVNVTISGDGTPQFQICDDATCSTVDHSWANTTTPLDPDQYLQLRLTSNGTNDTTHRASVTVGGSTSDWDVTTIGPKAVFVSSQTYNGDLGGLSGADSKCQTLADAAGLSGTFKAWLSLAAVSEATDRISHVTVNYIRDHPTDPIVANGWSDLIDGSLDQPISRDEYGVVQTSEMVWTNTREDGSLHDTNADYHCNGWTDGTSGWDGVVGHPNQTDDDWSCEDGTGDCSSSAPNKNTCNTLNRLYCFEQ